MLDIDIPRVDPFSAFFLGGVYMFFDIFGKGDQQIFYFGGGSGCVLRHVSQNQPPLGVFNTFPKCMKNCISFLFKQKGL